MEIKTNFFKEIKNNINIIFCGFIGVLIALAYCMIDKYNMLTKFIARFFHGEVVNGSFVGALYAVLLCVVLMMFLIFLIDLPKRKFTRHDFLLLVFNVSTLTITGLSFTYHVDQTKLINTIIIAVVGLIMFVIRCIRVNEPRKEKVMDLKEYKYSIFRKYHLAKVLVYGALVGIVVGLLIRFLDIDGIVGTLIPSWGQLAKLEKIGIVGAVIVTFAISFNLFTLIEGKNENVSCIDLVLAFLLSIILFSSINLAGREVVTPTQLHIFIASALLVFITLVIRMISVDPTVKMNKEPSKADIYYSNLTRKHSLIVASLIALAIFMCALKLDEAGLLNAFNESVSAYTIILIALLLIIGSIGLVSLFVNGFKARKLILFDYSLLIATMLSLMITFNLMHSFSILKLVIFVVLVSVVFTFLTLRINKHQLEVVDVTSLITSEVQDEDTTEVEEVIESEEVNEEVEEKDRLTIKTTRYLTKLKFASEETKAYYSAIKNALMSYGSHERISKRNESFRRKGLVAKISLSGKSIRLHLALDPKSELYPNSKYHQLDLSHKKQFVEVPFTLRIKSPRALKRALTLIDNLFMIKGINKKRKFEEVDYTKLLNVDGSAIFDKLGLNPEMKDSYSKEEFNSFVEKYPSWDNDTSNLVTKIDSNMKDGEILNVYIDTILDKVDLDVISVETLKEKGLIPQSTNRICIKIHSKLDKKITVICDDISLQAKYAVLVTDGIVILKK